MTTGRINQVSIVSRGSCSYPATQQAAKHRKLQPTRAWHRHADDRLTDRRTDAGHAEGAKAAGVNRCCPVCSWFVGLKNEPRKRGSKQPITTTPRRSVGILVSTDNSMVFGIECVANNLRDRRGVRRRSTINLTHITFVQGFMGKIARQAPTQAEPGTSGGPSGFRFLDARSAELVTTALSKQCGQAQHKRSL